MKRVLSALLTFIPLIVLAAPVTLTWDPYPDTQATMHAECKKSTASTFNEVGQTQTSNSTVTVESGVNPGESGNCRVWATKPGFQDSPRSGVADFTVPLPVLPQPVNVRAQVVP